MTPTFRVHLPALLAPMLAACVGRPGAAPPISGQLTRAESLYADVRAMRDRIDVSLGFRRTCGGWVGEVGSDLEQNRPIGAE